MIIKRLDNESVWCMLWVENKCQSHWPIFPGPEMLYLLRQFDRWNSNLWIMSQGDSTFDLKMNVGHSVLYFMFQWFGLISWRLFDGRPMTIKCLHNESVWCKSWHKNKFWSQRHIFHCPEFLSYSLKIIWWMNDMLLNNKSMWPKLWFISVFESTTYLKFAKLQYVSSGFRFQVITGSLMRLY